MHSEKDHSESCRKFTAVKQGSEHEDLSCIYCNNLARNDGQLGQVIAVVCLFVCQCFLFGDYLQMDVFFWLNFTGHKEVLPHTDLEDAQTFSDSDELYVSLPDCVGLTREFVRTKAWCSPL